MRATISVNPERMQRNIVHFLIGEVALLGLCPATKEMRRLMDLARA